MLAASASAESTLVPSVVEQVSNVHIPRAAVWVPVRFLASDALEGRGPATRGDVLARSYLATALEGLGYQPGAPGRQWEQAFDLVGVTSHMPQRWSFEARSRSIQ